MIKPTPNQVTQNKIFVIIIDSTMAMVSISIWALFMNMISESFIRNQRVSANLLRITSFAITPRLTCNQGWPKSKLSHNKQVYQVSQNGQ